MPYGDYTDERGDGFIKILHAVYIGKRPCDVSPALHLPVPVESIGRPVPSMMMHYCFKLNPLLDTLDR